MSASTLITGGHESERERLFYALLDTEGAAPCDEGIYSSDAADLVGAVAPLAWDERRVVRVTDFGAMVTDARARSAALDLRRVIEADRVVVVAMGDADDPALWTQAGDLRWPQVFGRWIDLETRIAPSEWATETIRQGMSWTAHRVRVADLK